MASKSAEFLSRSTAAILQDRMLLETDYNWRVDSAQGGASRTVADIGSPLVRYRAVYDRSADCRGDGGSVYRLANA